MYHHSGRLVYHHEFAVLIYDVQGYVLWLDGSLESWTVEHQCDDVPRANLMVAFHRFVVDMHISSICRFLNTVARGVLQLFAHEFIHPGCHLSGINLKAEMFI